MQTGQIEDVSDTAFMVAAYRAIESKRTDALFRDPLAAKLAVLTAKKLFGIGRVGRFLASGWWPYGPASLTSSSKPRLRKKTMSQRKRKSSKRPAPFRSDGDIGS